MRDNDFTAPASCASWWARCSGSRRRRSPGRARRGPARYIAFTWLAQTSGQLHDSSRGFQSKIWVNKCEFWANPVNFRLLLSRAAVNLHHLCTTLFSFYRLRGLAARESLRKHAGLCASAAAAHGRACSAGPMIRGSSMSAWQNGEVAAGSAWNRVQMRPPSSGRLLYWAASAAACSIRTVSTCGGVEACATVT
jgi:hypothetical protein